jgi:hypothetical protein
MQKVFALTPAEFSVKVQAHILEVRQMGAIKNGFEETIDPKTLGIVRKLQEFDDEVLADWASLNMPQVINWYFGLSMSATQRINALKEYTCVTDEERLEKFCELAFCMFLTKELDLMGIS